jgi:hypothetical protein
VGRRAVRVRRCALVFGEELGRLVSAEVVLGAVQCVRRGGGGGSADGRRGAARAAVSAGPVRGGGDGGSPLRREVLRVRAVGGERGVGGHALGLLEDARAAGRLRGELGGYNRHPGLHAASSHRGHGPGALLQGHIRREAQAQDLGAALGDPRASHPRRHQQHVRIGSRRRAVVQHLEDQSQSPGASPIPATLLRRRRAPLQPRSAAQASRPLGLEFRHTVHL